MRSTNPKGKDVASLDRRNVGNCLEQPFESRINIEFRLFEDWHGALVAGAESHIYPYSRYSHSTLMNETVIAIEKVLGKWLERAIRLARIFFPLRAFVFIGRTRSCLRSPENFADFLFLFPFLFFFLSPASFDRMQTRFDERARIIARFSVSDAFFVRFLFSGHFRRKFYAGTFNF